MRWTAFLFALALLAGCDTVADAVGLDSITVDLDEAGQGIPVSAGARAQTDTIDRGGAALPDVFDVESISISEDDVTYTPSEAAKAGGVLDTGEIDGFLIGEGVPAIGFSAVVEDDVVTDVRPSTVDVGTYDEARFQACLSQVPENERPTLQEGYENLTKSKTVDHLSTVIKKSSFSVTMMVCATGDLDGTVDVEAATFNLEF